MPLSPETQLGRYRIVSLIGSGGMGEVYLAQDTALQRKVALKVLPLEVAANQDRMRRFKQEATAAASLNHPNIAHIYEVGEAEGFHFIAMEYVHGHTLRELIHHENAELAKLLRILQHVAEGLAKAHAAGIVHRDLKPDNIMVSSDGHAKILDFGLVKLIETPSSGSGATRGEDPTIIQPQSTPGLVLGTMGYMSPEQAQGKTREIDHRSDIFSFGCILFEAITGRKAFSGSDTIETLNKIIREPAPALATYNAHAPADLQRIVRRCLAKDPDQRYQNIKDVAIELKEVRRDAEAAEVTLNVSSRTSPSEDAKTLGHPETTTARSGSVASNSPAGPVSTNASGAEFALKRRRNVIAIAAVVLVAGVLAAVAVWSYLNSRSDEVAVESIAVIPFANQSNDPNAEWISDGLTESIINNLTQLPNLKVIARSSVFRYKGKEVDPVAVGKELGVRAVLTGRMSQRDDTMVISAELIDIRDNKQLWGEKYQRKLADMLAVQREIAREITNNLRPTLSGVDLSMANKQYTVDTEAYQLYLKGRFYWNKRLPADLQKAITYFQQAIDRDPTYAQAYSGLADSYTLLTAYTSDPPARELMPKAKDAARKALAIDERLAEAHASLGQIAAHYDYDFATAEREYRLALELNPNYATAHQWLAELLSSLKRFDEANDAIRRALELDPVSLTMNRIYGSIMVAQGRYDEAIQQYRTAMELEPNSPTVHFFLARVYEAKGMYDDARSEYSLAASLAGVPREGIAKMDEAYAKGGWKAYVQHGLMQTALRPNNKPSPYMVAAFYARLGRKEEALEWLQKGYEERDFRMPMLGIDFEFDAFRSDPRFVELVRKMGLPQ